MVEKEQRFYQWVCIVSFFGLMFIDKNIEALLMLVIGHLIDIKYELKKLDRFRK